MKALTKNKPAKSEWPILNYTPAKTSQNKPKRDLKRAKKTQNKSNRDLKRPKMSKNNPKQAKRRTKTN